METLFAENGSVAARFSDGTRVVGTALIGTDGPRSKARELILGPEISQAKPSGFVLLNTISSYPKSVAMGIRSRTGEFIMAFNPRKHKHSTFYLMFPQDLTSPDPSLWKSQVMYSSAPLSLIKASHSERLSYLKQEAQSSGVVAEPFNSAIEHIPADTMVFSNELVWWEPVPFDIRGGRFTLAGDTAHPMTPHRGKALNHAICDVGNLVKALYDVRDGKMGLEEAVESYSKEMVERGSEEVRSALSNSKMIHDWDRLMESHLMTKGLARSN